MIRVRPCRISVGTRLPCTRRMFPVAIQVPIRSRTHSTWWFFGASLPLVSDARCNGHPSLSTRVHPKGCTADVAIHSSDEHSLVSCSSRAEVSAVHIKVGYQNTGMPFLTQKRLYKDRPMLLYFSAKNSWLVVKSRKDICWNLWLLDCNVQV